MQTLDVLLAEVGMTRGDLARRLGISRGAVYHWREVPPKRVLAVATILGVRPGRLSPEMYPPRLRA